MQYLTVIILIFSCLAALDRITGNHFGLGKEYERAFMLLGAMALSMIGMIVISPVIAQVMKPASTWFSEVFGLDASVIPASLFANDMGGAPLAEEMAGNEKIGMFNALVVSSMMGCTISFTIPFSLGVVGKEHHNELLPGILCGIVTIPVGCFVSGLICKIPVLTLIANLLPLVIFSALIAAGLFCFPGMSVKIFKWFGVFITAVITIGLTLGVVRFLTGYELIKGMAPIEEGADVCFNAAVVLSGSFPFIFVLSKVLMKPLRAISRKTGTNEIAIVGIVSCLASSANSFGTMDKMDKKGVMLNSAFAVSGAFILGSHLAFTMAYDASYVLPVVVGKFVSAVSALVLSNIVYNKKYK